MLNSSSKGNSPRPKGRWAVQWILILVPALLALEFSVLFSLETATDPRLRLACDRAVETALTTDSVIELQRADYVTQHLRCDVRGRISRRR